MFSASHQEGVWEASVESLEVKLAENKGVLCAIEIWRHCQCFFESKTTAVNES